MIRSKPRLVMLTETRDARRGASAQQW